MLTLKNEQVGKFLAR